MTLRMRGWWGGLLVAALGWTGMDHECRASMTLQFNIEPLTQPRAGSLTQESEGTLRATNLAVTSVESINTGKQVNMAQYLDFQSSGTGGMEGPNFFMLSNLAEQAHGTVPTAFTSLTGDATVTQLADQSYLFMMRINYGYVSNAISSNFAAAGVTNEMGWTGLLTLHIAAFKPALASAQVTSGTLVLTSADPVPAGQEIGPNVVPEPASCLLAGLGLLAVGGAHRRVRRVRDAA